MKYRVLKVQESDQIEPLGTKQKFWFRDQDGVRCLFKAGRPGTGENWSERTTCELARRIGLPCAHYELARWNDLCGVVAPSFIPQHGRLVLGNEVLARVIPGYDPRETYRARDYRLSTICALLGKYEIGPPLDFKTTAAAPGPLQVFIGYLIFDCWIGNPDRHHENWGFVVTPDPTVHLAPTFDHASGLGVRLSDDERRDRLTTKDRGFGVESYVKKARTPFHSASGKKLFTLEVVRELARHDSEAVSYWLARLDNVTQDEITAVFNAMPDDYLSAVEAEFATRMLAENKKRMEWLR